jgi:hypothetical protein
LFPLLKGIDSLLFNDESIFDLNRVRSEGEANSRGRKRLRRREKKKERESYPRHMSIRFQTFTKIIIWPMERNFKISKSHSYNQ